MPRKKKLDETDKNDLRNYTLLEEKVFFKIYKKLGNKEEYLKIVDKNADDPKYYIWTNYLRLEVDK